MKHLLDTNVCVDYLRGRDPGVLQRFRESSPGDLCLSSVVVAELRYGADKSSEPRKNHSRLDVFLGEIACEDFDSRAAAEFGRLRALLESRGLSIGPYDMMIAAHALSLGLTLVTDNVREFSRVEGLRIENWREP
jgi:tRNA(fMet)-specific endonuclease VapC